MVNAPPDTAEEVTLPLIDYQLRQVGGCRQQISFDLQVGHSGVGVSVSRSAEDRALELRRTALLIVGLILSLSACDDTTGNPWTEEALALRKAVEHPVARRVLEDGLVTRIEYEEVTRTIQECAAEQGLQLSTEDRAGGPHFLFGEQCGARRYHLV